MSETARITVTAGPDKGKVYDLQTEMVRLGRAPENEVALTDGQVLEQHASIVRREGRFAIHTSVPDGIEVDGTLVPPERWVWLPETATIRIGARTCVEFVVAAPAGESRSGERPPAANGAGSTSRGTSGTVASPPAKEKTSRTRRSAEASGSDTPNRTRRTSGEKGDRQKRTTIARFITDGPGDPLVKLGEDGHLPELALHEAQSGARPEAGPKQSNPMILVGVLGLSVSLTLAMLFMDMGSFGSSIADKTTARQEIVEYYGKDNERLQPYQEILREARRAYSRRDFEGERRAYREVLAQLRSEAKDKVSRYTGLTGRIDYDPSSSDKKSDKRLEQLIGILLSE